MSEHPLALVVVIAILVFVIVMIFVANYESQKPIREDRRAARASNEYMKMTVEAANRIRHLKLFGDDNLVIPGVKFDGAIGYRDLLDPNPYIGGIEAARIDTRVHPTNPVCLYTAGLKAGSSADQFLLGAINTYRTKLVHVVHFEYSGESGSLTQVYDSESDGEYTSHMLAEDVRRHLNTTRLSW